MTPVRLQIGRAQASIDPTVPLKELSPGGRRVAATGWGNTAQREAGLVIVGRASALDQRPRRWYHHASGLSFRG